MDFKKYLESTAKQLDQEVGEILKQQLALAGKTDKKLVPLMKAFIRSCRGGKRIRGMLIKLGYELTGGKSKEIMKMAAAYEICHAGILAHDDIMDKDTLRRGRPSLYQALGGNHYGISQAICLADFSFFLATKIIADTDFTNKNQALKLFSQVMLDTAWGQMLDIEKANPKLVMKLKTACYTIAGPLQVGAVLAGVGPDSPRLRGIKEFGENLGMAYQVRDDILDSEADYLGGVEKAKKEVEKYTNQAMKIIPEITNDKDLSKILEQMGEYLVQRNK